jgi:hypothetical protein
MHEYVCKAAISNPKQSFKNEYPIKNIKERDYVSNLNMSLLKLLSIISVCMLSYVQYESDTFVFQKQNGCSRDQLYKFLNCI